MDEHKRDEAPFPGPYDKDGRLKFSDSFSYFLENRRSCMFIILLFISLAALISFVTPRIYRAETEIEVSIIRKDGSSRSPSDWERDMIMRLARSPAVIKRAAEKSGIKEWYYRRMSVEYTGASQAGGRITISYEYSDPGKCAAYINDYAGSLMETVGGLTGGAVGVDTERLERLEREIARQKQPVKDSKKKERAENLIEILETELRLAEIENLKAGMSLKITGPAAVPREPIDNRMVFFLKLVAGLFALIIGQFIWHLVFFLIFASRAEKAGGPRPPDEGMDIRDYIGILRKRKLIVLLSCAVFFLAGYVINNLILKPVYMATAEIKVELPVEIIFSPLLSQEAIMGVSMFGGREERATLMADGAIGDRVAVEHGLDGKEKLKEYLDGISTSVTSSGAGTVRIMSEGRNPEKCAEAANANARALAEMFAEIPAAEKTRIEKLLETAEKAHVKFAFEPVLTKEYVEKLDGLKAEISEEAKLPQRPIKPKKNKNTVIFTILGLMLGMGLAFFIEEMEKGKNYNKQQLRNRNT